MVSGEGLVARVIAGHHLAQSAGLHEFAVPEVGTKGVQAGELQEMLGVIIEDEKHGPEVPLAVEVLQEALIGWFL